MVLPYDGTNLEDSFTGGISDMPLTPDIVMPITLTDFSASLHPIHGVLSKWTTAMEVNNKEFILQRSADGMTFTDVKTLPGAGNSSNPRSYSTTDESPLPGISFYRLKQVDFDGTTTYSKVVSVKNNRLALAPISIKSAHPNPFRDETKVNFSLASDTKVTLTLSNALGKTIETTALNGRAGTNSYTVQGHKLSSGLYFMRMTDGRESANYKLIKRN
jgi:hypothetical protein